MIGSRLLGIWLLAASAVMSQTLYVSPEGNDLLGDGSAERPYASVTAAVAAAPLTGGTILVRNGTYTGRQRINRRFTGWLTIRAESPYKAKLQSANETPLHIFDAALVEVTGFDVFRTDARSSSPLAAQISRSRNIVLRNNLLHDSRNNDVLKINEAPRDILIIGNLFYNAEGAAGQHIDVNGGTDVVIRDNIFSSDFEQQPVLDGSAYVVIKNSGDVPESRRIQVTSNVFLNWQGSTGKNFILLGEDGKQFHETQDVRIENNLLIGNSSTRMRSAFGAKGVKDIVFRNNTIAGDLPASAYAMRINREGGNLLNRNLQFINNIWSDPGGTMNNFSDGLPTESEDAWLLNNVYWNGDRRLPSGFVLTPDNDSDRIEADPMLGSQDGLVLPRWTGESFVSGSQTIRQEFERFVTLYGTPAERSQIRGRGLAWQTPRTDILDRLRAGDPDPGAVQTGASPALLRVVPAFSEITGGMPSALNQLILPEPAGPNGVEVMLTSSKPDFAVVPEKVFVGPGLEAVSFPIHSIRVAAPENVTITAQFGELARAADVVIEPQRVSAINLAPESLFGGGSTSRNLVLIDGIAPAEGARIFLFSSNPELVTVPEFVQVQPGRSYSDFFPVQTKFLLDPVSVTIRAVWEKETITAAEAETRQNSGRLTVLPNVAPMK